MSGAVITKKEDAAFTLVVSPRHGQVISSLYRHLNLPKGQRFLKALVQNGSINKLQQLETNNAILLILKPETCHDLYSCLPPAMRAKYPRYRLEDRHIRVDKMFGSRAKLFYQWHYTERINLNNNQCMVAHIYFHYGKLVEIVVKVDNQVIDINNSFSDMARENCSDALLVMRGIISHMTEEKNRLAEEFDTLLNKISMLDLKNTNPSIVDELLKKAKCAFDSLNLYQDDTIDKRFEQTKNYVLAVRQAQQSGSEVPATPDDETQKKLPAAARSKYRRKNAVAKIVPVKKPEISPEQVQNLKIRFDVLHAKANKISNAKEASSFNQEALALKLDVECAYVNATDKVLEKKCEILRALVAREPSLYDCFKDFIYKLQEEDAKELFPAIQAAVPPNFYTEFLGSIFKSELTRAQEASAVNLCKYFFERSQDYRLLLSLYNRVSETFVANDGKTIGLSSLIQCPLWGYFELFKLIVEQMDSGDINGYLEAGNCATLITVFCTMSKPGTDIARYILLLLKYNPPVANPKRFAIPANYWFAEVEPDEHRDKMLNNISVTKIFKDSEGPSREHLSDDDSIVASYTVSMGDSVFAGSALAAYCQADFKDNEVLHALLKVTPTLHVIYSCAMFSLTDVDFTFVYSSRKLSFQTEASLHKLKELNKAESALIKNGADYLGIYYSHEDPEKFEQLKSIMTEARTRIDELNNLQIAEMCADLCLNEDIYSKRGDFLRAMACQKAVLLLAISKEVSLTTHELILKSLLRAGDLALMKGHETGSELLIDHSHMKYMHAVEFARKSKFRSTLENDPGLRLAKKNLESLESKDTLDETTGNDVPKLKNCPS